MARNAITPGGFVRRALPALLVAALLAAALGACGSERPGPTTAVPDRELDAATLNEILSRQLGAVATYQQVLPGLRGAERALAERMRAQEQEHVDAVLKALRGIGAGPPAAEPEAIPMRELGGREDRLRFLYQLQSATIDAELNAITRLTGAWPRALLATIAGNQAQHLALLRQALGAGPLAAIPSAFEDGTEEPPQRRGTGSASR